MTDISQLFFRPMHTAMARTDMPTDEAARMRASLDAIVLNGSSEQFFPRTASRRADDVIERMVNGVVGAARALGAADQLADTKKIDMCPTESHMSKKNGAKRRPGTDATKATTTLQQSSPLTLSTDNRRRPTPMSDNERDENLTRSQQEELDEHGAVDLGDTESEDNGLGETARDMEEDFEDDDDDNDDEEDDNDRGPNLYDSSDDQEVEAAAAQIHDEEEAQQWAAAMDGSNSSDDSDVSDMDSDDARTASNSKAKASSKSKKSSTTPSGSTMTEYRKQQGDLKRKRGDEFSQLDNVLRGYTEVAAWQASGYAPKLRKLLLGEQQTEQHSQHLAHCLTALEAHIGCSLSLARKATPSPYTEIVDFVKGASAVTAGPAKRAEQASQCDILQRPPKPKEQLTCLRALHTVTDANGTVSQQWKSKVCLARLVDLIKAFHFAHNMMALTEQLCHARLSTLKKQVKASTNVPTDVKTLLHDKTKLAVPLTLKRQLKNALDKIDTSAKKLV